MMKRNDYKRLFDSLSPTDEQLIKMKAKIYESRQPTRRPGLRLRLVPVVCALTVLALGITAVSASPALKRYFFPGVGVVEADESTDAPLYMMLDLDSAQNDRYTVTNGYWHDGTARFWLETQLRYDEKEASELLPYTDAAVENYAVSQPTALSPSVGKYCVTIPNVTSDEAAEGLLFDGHAVKFSGMPAEYRPYTTEECGLRLTMIPLTETLDTFAVELEHTDGRGEISPTSTFEFSTAGVENDPSFTVVDEYGRVYPMQKIRGTNIFCTTEKPKAKIVRFESDCITFSSDFDEGVTVTIDLPEKGTAKEVNKTFTFPDGVTEGMITAIGYDNCIKDEWHVEAEKYFPSGYVSLTASNCEANGIKYWYGADYTDEYRSFIEPYLTEEYKSPYDSTFEPMAPRTLYRVIDDGLHTSLHYIDDGSGRFDAVVTYYTAQAFADWRIMFN